MPPQVHTRLRLRHRKCIHVLCLRWRKCIHASAYLRTSANEPQAHTRPRQHKLSNAFVQYTVVHMHPRLCKRMSIQARPMPTQVHIRPCIHACIGECAYTSKPMSIEVHTHFASTNVRKHIRIHIITCSLAHTRPLWSMYYSAYAPTPVPMHVHTRPRLCQCIWWMRSLSTLEWLYGGWEESQLWNVQVVDEESLNSRMTKWWMRRV